MSEQEKLIKILENLEEGVYKCFREVFEAGRKPNGKELFIFKKMLQNKHDNYPFMVIGSDCIYSAAELTGDSRHYFTNFYDIQKITVPHNDKLIDYSGPHRRKKRTNLQSFKCINPTKTLKKNKIYKGFVSEEYKWNKRNWNDRYIKTIHVINEHGRHLSYSADRFKLISYDKKII